MEIVSTEKEQVPILKSVEWNKEKHRIEKIIKFYDFETNTCQKENQFLVDWSAYPSNMAESFFEISVLHFQNFIFFFMRDENNDRHLQLKCVNVNTGALVKIPDYSLNEPVA